MTTDNNPRTLKTVENTCEILNALKELNGARLTELADHLGMSKGGVYNHLATLQNEEYVVKTGKEYKLSHRFFNMGEFVKHRNKLYSVGKSEVDKLAEETGESTHLMIEQFGKGTYYHKARGQMGISQDYHQNLLEETDYLHWTSTGKAILANMTKERVEEIVDQHGLPSMTENTITEISELFDELDEIRDRGFALNDEEQIRGVRAVGACVKDHQDDILGAISVSGPTSRISDEKFYDTYPELVMQTANVIEVACDTQGSDFNPDI